MEACLHVLRNLTALPSETNNDISNKPFSDKIAAVKADATASATRLQSWLSDTEYSPSLIDDRTHEFVVKLVTFWLELDQDA